MQFGILESRVVIIAVYIGIEFVSFGPISFFIVQRAGVHLCSLVKYIPEFK